MLGQFLTDAGLVAQIGLGADNQAGNAGAMVTNFGEPLLTNVLERRGRGNGETDQEDISLRVRERAETVVVFLTSGIEQSKGVRLIANPRDRQLSANGFIHARDRMVNQSAIT